MNAIRKALALLLALLAVSISGVRAEDKKAEQSDLEKLQGEWSMLSGIANGYAVQEELLRTCKRICKADETTVVLDGEVIMKAKFTLDPSKKPKTIDYQVTGGPAKGGTLLGIYELDGNTVKFCFGAPGAERPTKFASKLGDNWTFSIWEHKKDKETAPPK